MKKTLLLFLCMIMLVGTVLSLSACKKCEEHIDANHDLICDVCEEATEPSNFLPRDYYTAFEQPIVEHYGKASEISDLENMTMDSYRSNNYFIIFYRDTYYLEDGDPQYVIINAETGEDILTIKYEERDADDEDWTETSFSVSSNLLIKKVAKYEESELVNYTHTLLDVNGNTIATKTTKSSSVSPYFYNEEMFSFDGKLYKYVDGVASEMFEIGLSSIPDFDYASDKYYYRLDSAKFGIYDSNFKLVECYELPNDNAEEANFSVLANGNVLIQYLTYLPEDAAEYDIFDGDKYTLSSYIFNVETKEYSEIALDFVVEGVVNGITMPDAEGANFDNIVNLAAIYKIDNKSYATDEIWVSLSNDGQILGYLDNTIPSQYYPASIIDDDRYLVLDKSGKQYVIKGDGTMVGEVSGASFNYDTCRFYKDGKYYDTDLNMVLDTNESDYTLVSNYLYRGEANSDGEYKYYIIKNDDFAKIDVEKSAYNFEVYTNYFCYTYRSAGTSYRVYCNNLGEEILEINVTSGSYSASTYGDCLIITYSHSGTTEYYFSSLK